VPWRISSISASAAAAVAEGQQAGLGRHAQRRADVDGVDAQVVGHRVQPGDGVGVVDAQVGAHQADGLILDAA
jgi:hypothetical protein